VSRFFKYDISPPVDFHIGPIPVTRTVTMTWVVMAILILVALLVRRQLARGRKSGLRTICEALMVYLDGEIRDIVRRPPAAYFPLIATLFIFILVANLVSAVPRMRPPTADIACAGALALVVFIAVPFYGIRERGLFGYLKAYFQPVWIMFPFNVIGEVSRTLAMTVRLFGNIMSGAVIVGVLVFVGGVVAVPIGMLGLLTGLIQAYIFAMLTMVYIGGAVRAAERTKERDGDVEKGA